ncbi:hypothetical protein HMPREF1624_08319 [Sporothrix schenckii ATCC 58251]|uniref:XPG-I domain-containing protein n=1 Tax=Sporothrix schenckii (strain ATCC 58251 / de Perez 2211183) TaxID=1391915 RepID=U7PKL3_SPOS1|nr:hypothetical protein HMPREF1624_08319 [Sporothrix schenckii ATCC 58251]
MVQHFGVTPYLVFDGDFLPSKASTEASRAKRREESRKAGQELMNAGNPKQAFVEFQKAIDVTPEMACHLIEELKKLGLPYIVAPYEADAQMVYLEREGLVSGIISEDSDLLVDGVEVPASPADFKSQQTEDVVTSQEDNPITRVSLDRFSYTGALKFAHGLPTPDTSFIESHEKPTKPSILTPPSSISQRQTSRHQTNAPKMSLGELVETTSVTRSERPRSSTTKRIRRSMEASIPINPSFVPLPPADLDEVAALNRPQGSEDQIVPDSDGDDDDDNVAEQRGQRAPGGRLDLSRFLCA